jgi:hypothetical protein
LANNIVRQYSIDAAEILEHQKVFLLAEKSVWELGILAGGHCGSLETFVTKLVMKLI